MASKQDGGTKKMDTTKEIRDASPHIRKEYKLAMNEVLKKDVKDRDARDRTFVEERKKFSPETEKHFSEQVKEREGIHFHFMSIVFPEVHEREFSKPLPQDYTCQDQSKDDQFFFIFAVHFDILKTPQDESEEELKRLTKLLVDYELHRHYMLEPNHPEYEKVTGKECSDVNILEMAVDRLARNVQFNHGNIDMARMEKFWPKFHVGDTERKDKLYGNFVNKHKEFVSRRSKQLYFEKPLEEK